MSAFLDTSFVLALEVDGDANRMAALAEWQRIERSDELVVTSSAVVEELSAFLNSRGMHAKAVEVGNSLMQSPNIECVFVDRELFEAGWKWFVRHKDKRYSLADCFAFVLMKRRGITAALTFDKHFSQAGFKTVP